MRIIFSTINRRVVAGIILPLGLRDLGREEMKKFKLSYTLIHTKMNFSVAPLQANHTTTSAHRKEPSLAYIVGFNYFPPLTVGELGREGALRDYLSPAVASQLARE